MSIRSIFAGLAAAVAVVLMAPSASAQIIQPQVRNFYVGQYAGTYSESWEQNSEFVPFATVQKALEEVRDFLSTTPSHGVVNVLIAGGEYHITQPLVFTQADSGNATFPINWIAWNGVGSVQHQTPNDDALICGGVHPTTGWSIDNTISVSEATVYKIALSSFGATAAPRDLWYDGKRMIRARFPNPPESNDNGEWEEDWPETTLEEENELRPPYANEGFLVVKAVRRNEDPDEQELDIGNGLNYAGQPRTYQIPNLSSWDGVELSAFNGYVAPRQIIRLSTGDDADVNTTTNLLTVKFNIVKQATPSPNSVDQDTGGLGVFDLEDSLTNEYNRRFLQVQGDNPLPGGLRPAQIVLENHLGFLDRINEWFCDGTHLWVVLPCGNAPDPEGSPGVVFPVVEKLLVLEETEYVEFTGIDFAYSDMPFPTQGWETFTPEPGYATVQSGWQWQDTDDGRKHRVLDALPASIQLRGANNITFDSCRFGHFGGSGISIGPRYDHPAEDEYLESSDNEITQCEILDVGGHGINIGDHRTQQTDAWATGTHQDTRPEPHDNNSVTQSYIHHYAVSYKDGAGILIAHTRNTTISDNKVDLGNWSGICVGGLQLHKFSARPSCAGQGPTSAPQTNEHVVLQRNFVHKACLRLNDGAGIYVMGSQEAGSTTRSEMDGNYVERIDHDPFKNYVHVVCGLYFDGGSDGWLIKNNFIANSHYPFRFAAKVSRGNCNDESCKKPSSALAWGSGAWPIPWIPTCNLSTPIQMPGQNWSTSTPNWWLDRPGYLPQEQAGYANVDDCPGWWPLANQVQVGTTTYNMTFPSYTGSGSAENWYVNGYQVGGVPTITAAAGPDEFEEWFPTTGELILPIPFRPCTQEDSPYVEIEWPW